MRAALALFIFLLLSSSAFAREPWPVVRSFKTSFEIDWTAPEIDIDLPILADTGAVAYRFICRGGTDDHRLDALSERQNGINYVGPLMCVLNEGDQETEATLLAEDDGRPWHSRGQFHNRDLVDACGNYPEHGRVRSFRLRGFELTLDLSNTQVIEGKAVRSIMKINVAHNPRIFSELSQATGYDDPREDCTKVLKKPVPVSTLSLNIMRYRY